MRALNKSVQAVLATKASTLRSFVLFNPINSNDLVLKGFVLKAIDLEHLVVKALSVMK